MTENNSAVSEASFKLASNSSFKDDELGIPKEFLLGSSISSWQYEGNIEGIYQNQNFIEKMYNDNPQNWYQGYGPDKAIDFLTNWKQDAQLMIDAGLQSVRFTIDWSRFYTNIFTKELNHQYINTYLNFSKKLKANGIKLFLILEHWDMPYELYEKYNGYVDVHVQDMFVNYASDVFETFNNIVDYYMVFNEPIVIPQLSFLERKWYPYECNTKYAIAVMHAKNVMTSKAINTFRELKISGEIGIGGINIEPISVRDESNPEDVKAGIIAEYFSGQMFIDPFINNQYNPNFIDFLKQEELMFELTNEQKNNFMTANIDFIGVNYYHPDRICSPDKDSEGLRKYFNTYKDESKRFNVDRGWEVEPTGLYKIGMQIKSKYKNIKWFVNENGYGTEEYLTKREDSKLLDSYRSAFVNEHIYNLMLVNKDGGNCFGYHTWSFCDNCSPYNAMKNRYGFVEVDVLDDFKRKPKASYYYYQKLIKERKIRNNMRFEDFI